MRQFLQSQLRGGSYRVLNYSIFSRNLYFAPKFNFTQENKPVDQLKQTLDFQENEFPDNPQYKERLEILTNMHQFEKGMEFLEQGKYRLAMKFFVRVRKYLEDNEMPNGEPWVKVSKKIALTQNKLRLYEECEKTLEGIIENQQKYHPNDPMIYESYNNLFVHCLRTNINKAILLGKALLSEQEKIKIPPAYQKQIIFNLGTAYLLKENYVDAKERLRECLTSEPNALLKGYTLNNLAVASWWHKIPSLREFIDDEDDKTNESQEAQVNQKYDNNYTDEQVDYDFQYVVPLLKRSIKFMESVSSSNDSEKQWLNAILDETHLVPKDFKIADIQDMVGEITRKECGIPLLNITEFIFNTDSKKRPEAQFWFKYTLKFYQQNDASSMDRSLILLGWLCSSSKQYERAEALFRRTLEMLDSTDSYNKILCLQLYGSMLKSIPERVSEGERLLAQAYAQADNLPSWSNRLIHVLVPDLEL